MAVFHLITDRQVFIQPVAQQKLKDPATEEATISHENYCRVRFDAAARTGHSVCRRRPGHGFN